MRVDLTKRGSNPKWGRHAQGCVDSRGPVTFEEALTKMGSKSCAIGFEIQSLRAKKVTPGGDIKEQPEIRGTQAQAKKQRSQGREVREEAHLTRS